MLTSYHACYAKIMDGGDANNDIHIVHRMVVCMISLASHHYNVVATTTFTSCDTESSMITVKGYVDHPGPSLFCTGNARRRFGLSPGTSTGFVFVLCALLWTLSSVLLTSPGGSVFLGVEGKKLEHRSRYVFIVFNNSISRRAMIGLLGVFISKLNDSNENV